MRVEGYENPEFVVKFIKNFIHPPRAERVTLELLRGDIRFESRLAHQLDTLLASRFRKSPWRPGPTQRCYKYGGSSPVHGPWEGPFPWSEVQASMIGNGGVHLIVGLDGEWFYAEEEGFPPTPWSGHVSER